MGGEAEGVGADGEEMVDTDRLEIVANEFQEQDPGDGYDQAAGDDDQDDEDLQERNPEDGCDQAADNEGQEEEVPQEQVPEVEGIQEAGNEGQDSWDVQEQDPEYYEEEDYDQQYGWDGWEW